MFTLYACVYVCVCVFIYTHIHIHAYMYICNVWQTCKYDHDHNMQDRIHDVDFWADLGKVTQHNNTIVGIEPHSRYHNGIIPLTASIVSSAPSSSSLSCQKRRTSMRRDAQKRPTNETFIVSFAPPASCLSCQKRHVQKRHTIVSIEPHPRCSAYF